MKTTKKNRKAVVFEHTAETYFHKPAGNWMLVREYPPPDYVVVNGRKIHKPENAGGSTFEGRILAVGPDVTRYRAGMDVSWMPHDGSASGHLQQMMEAGRIQFLRGDRHGDVSVDQVVSTLDYDAREAHIQSAIKAVVDGEVAAASSLAEERRGRLAVADENGLDPQLPDA